MLQLSLFLVCALTLPTGVGQQKEECNPSLLAYRIRGFCISDVPSPSCCVWLRKLMDTENSSNCVERVAAQPELLHIGMSLYLINDMYEDCVSSSGSTAVTTDINQRTNWAFSPPPPPNPSLLPAQPPPALPKSTPSLAVNSSQQPSEPRSWYSVVCEFLDGWLVIMVKAFSAAGATVVFVKYMYKHGGKAYRWARCCFKGEARDNHRAHGSRTGVIIRRRCYRRSPSPSPSSSGMEMVPPIIRSDIFRSQ